MINQKLMKEIRADRKKRRREAFERIRQGEPLKSPIVEGRPDRRVRLLLSGLQAGDMGQRNM